MRSPPAGVSDAGLAEMARLYGVETSFVDAGGQPRTTDEDAMVGVLAALGAPVDDVAGGLRAERLRRHLEVLPPVIALPPTVPQVVEVSLPRSVHPRDCWLTLEAEHGAFHRSRVMPAVHRPLGGCNLEGLGMDRFEVRITPTVTDVLPAGYYRLRVEGPGVEAGALVVVPPRCPEPTRSWGTFMPVHSLRRAPDWGIGTYPALAELVSLTVTLGGGFVGTLPLFPIMDPESPSPYLPASRLVWNELYVDPTALPETELVPGAVDVLGSAATQAPGPAEVDYPATAALVRQALEPMAEALLARPSRRRDELEAYGRDHPEAAAYARFRAEREPGGPADAVVGYHLYAQWAAAQQLEAVGGRLLLDFPVGVDPDGFDAWSHAGSFATGVQGGAPPDPFFEGGQQWGFRPLHPRATQEDEHRYLIACLRHVMSRASVLRLDHVMSLHRLYWVPEGFDAAHGAYVRYPSDQLRAVVSLEAARSGTVVVGEDLGTVPDEVRTAMGHDRMLRSWVLELEMRGPGDVLATPPELSIASLGSHDLPRFAVWWGAGAADARDRCLDHLAAGPARLVMVDVEDLWLERRPQNRPGTRTGNWCQRSERTVEELRSFADRLVRVDELRRTERRPRRRGRGERVDRGGAQ